MTETNPPPAAPRRWMRFAPLALIVAALAAVRLSGLHEHLSLEALRDSSAALDAYVRQHFLLSLAIFMGVYTLAVAISLPGALFLTLGGGYLFGVWIGGASVVVAATLGATLIFLAAKTAFGDALRARAGGWLQKLEQGFSENAFNYLLALRLFPGAPFFIVNLAPAFLKVKARDFILATFIGIIPGTLVYAAVGNGLRAAFQAGANVDPVVAARQLLLSPEIIAPIAGLIALSLAPVILKALRPKAQGATP